MVSYWKSTEHLLAYAKMRSAEHLPAWRAFNKHIGTNGDVSGTRRIVSPQGTSRVSTAAIAS